MEKSRKYEIFKMSKEDLEGVCKNQEENFSEDEILYAKQLLNEFEQSKKIYDDADDYTLYSVLRSEKYPMVDKDYVEKCLERHRHSETARKFGSVEESVNEMLVRINQNLYESKEHLKVIKGCVIFFTILIVIGLILGIVGVVSLSSVMSALSTPSKYLR